ncbi:hypothetical protein G6F46_004375 [Rhizopus delemar]|uniref:RING-type E3 ubiquitin transferase n=2 Tax=Rhizopus TaxID=4842 RepID=A0A9P6Z312_9FUNG|nr:hypothetical protein G6F43_009103 [Rhizopus delemar]KAG1554000.1 hypothetical protein G6F51_000246 [Rhizopus arrhizus]KAG1454398.1 hypothetical protein G6F55_007628 [Rhizopus delemar]KAG1497670.1 hypothetical protein G6F54_005611 [Rhizopus delemar]KAG1514064.1 hypothetical protein G6F53_003956 [Rhizopus delemar]
MEENIPKCSICMHRYTNETFLRPCFHSFCFECICYWINITPDSAHCPICRQKIKSLVYNVDEEEDDFDEYFLNDQKKHHEPPLHRKRTLSPTEKIRLQRRQVYKGLFTTCHYPEPLSRHVDFTVITPEHIPRASIFLGHELAAIHGVDSVDPFIVNHITQILLIPYNAKMKQMDDSTVIKKISEWLKDDRDNALAERLLNELIAYLKSGLSYRDFVSSTIYEP